MASIARSFASSTSCAIPRSIWRARSCCGRRWRPWASIACSIPPSSGGVFLSPACLWPPFWRSAPASGTPCAGGWPRPSCVLVSRVVAVSTPRPLSPSQSRAGSWPRRWRRCWPGPCGWPRTPAWVDSRGRASCFWRWPSWWVTTGRPMCSSRAISCVSARPSCRGSRPRIRRRFRASCAGRGT